MLETIKEYSCLSFYSALSTLISQHFSKTKNALLPTYTCATTSTAVAMNEVVKDIDMPILISRNISIFLLIATTSICA